MKKTIGVLMLCAFGTMTPHAADWTVTVKLVERSVVYVEAGDYKCTGFVIDAARRYVLTAAHCDTDTPGVPLFADRVRAEVVSKDTQKDLMVLVVKDLDPMRPALTLAPKNPATGQEVLSAGYGYALERMMFRVAHVADAELSFPDIGGPFVGVDSGYINGQSGGPVVDRLGHVVAYVQRASDKLGIGVGAEILRERTGRFWGAR